MNNRTRLVAALAAISFTAISIPAFAQGSDPEVGTTAAKQDATAKPKLSSRAKSVKLCRRESEAPDAKTICKTRGQWIREGRDPLGVY